MMEGARPLSMLRKHAKSAFIWVQLAGGLLGMFVSRIVPTEAGTSIGLAGGVVCAAGWVLMSEATERSVRYFDVEPERMRKLMMDEWSRRLVMTFVGLMLGYSSFAWGYPWLVNKFFGSTATRSVPVSGWISGSPRGCSRPDIGNAFLVESPRALCVDERVPAGTMIRVTGPETFMGLNVEAIYLVADNHKLN